MLAEQRRKTERGRANAWSRGLLWLSGLWVLPLWAMPRWSWVVACLLAPLPALLLYRRRENGLLAELRKAREEAEQLTLHLDNVRHRTARLREDLSAADRQARLSRQLTVLGQFTAGFMHEFNNPLAIVANRIEVLLEERQQDTPLCGDLQQMLAQTRYMGNIARTLLHALRRERGSDVFVPPCPVGPIDEAVDALRPSAAGQGVRLAEELSDVPRVNVPEHVISEVVRGLLSNALEALKGRADGTIWIRMDAYRTAGAKVVLRIEDNGPGVPENIRGHLFEPFISQSAGRERLGLGLFLAASLLDMYEGTLRYEERAGGGARFTVEMPAARFTRGQPYHWFAGGTAE